MNPNPIGRRLFLGRIVAFLSMPIIPMGGRSRAEVVHSEGEILDGEAFFIGLPVFGNFCHGIRVVANPDYPGSFLATTRYRWADRFDAMNQIVGSPDDIPTRLVVHGHQIMYAISVRGRPVGKINRPEDIRPDSLMEFTIDFQPMQFNTEWMIAP